MKPNNTSAKRLVETDPEVADMIRLYCFLRGVTMKSFVTESLRKSIEPYRPWIESVQKLRSSE